MHYIYKIKSPSGKTYIGQTKRPIQRKSAYKNLRCCGQKIIYNSILKYGWDNHVFEIVCTANIPESEFNGVESIRDYRWK